MSRLALNTQIGPADGGGAVTASTTATLISNGTGGTDNTFGSFVELIASNHTYTNKLILYGYSNNSGVGAHGHINIAIDASGAEQVIIEGVEMQHPGTANGDSFTILDIEIPEGARVSAQLGSSSNFMSYFVSANTWYEPGSAKTRVVHSTFVEGGRNANTPRQVLQPPTADNSWGQWNELAVSVENTGKLIQLLLASTDRTTGQGNERYYAQIGIGVAGAETPICHPVQMVWNSWGVTPVPPSILLPGRIPKGSRLSVRFQSDNVVAHTPYTITAMYMVFGG